MDGWRRLSATRPGWYRAVTALGALVAAAGLVVAVLAADLSGAWRLGTGVFCAIGLASCLWDARPPREGRQDETHTPAERAPTG